METKLNKETVIKVKNLSFSYGKTNVLKNVSFEIERGKITTILGANGCGKSTLFSLMTRNLFAKKGSIFLDGKNIRKLSLTDFAKKVSIVHQYNTISDDITVEKVVAYGRTPYRNLFGRNNYEDNRLIQQALEITNLLEYRKREIGKLSGGQRQRVWIAMALAQNTKILFLDEPTTYLDIHYQLEILKLIKKLNEEYQITIIMVLHDINQAIHYSDRIIGLQGGEIAIKGNPQDVITTESIYKLYGVQLEVASINNVKVVLTF